MTAGEAQLWQAAPAGAGIPIYCWGMQLQLAHVPTAGAGSCSWRWYLLPTTDGSQLQLVEALSICIYLLASTPGLVSCCCVSVYVCVCVCVCVHLLEFVCICCSSPQLQHDLHAGLFQTIIKYLEILVIHL